MLTKINIKMISYFLSLKKIIYEDPEKGGLPVLVVYGLWAGGAIITAWWIGKVIPQGVSNFFLGLLGFASYLLIYLARFLCLTATQMLDTSLTYLTKPIIKDATFLTVWGSVRDLGNMFIVLSFVIVGICTALRIQEYGAKKVLGRLIIIALLINFSGLLCGVIIDASNIVSTSLIQNGGYTVNSPCSEPDAGTNCSIGYQYYTLVNTFGSAILQQYSGLNSLADGQHFLAAAIGVAGIYLVIAITFFYMAVIFIARYAVLAFLYILSPLAFVFWIFPSGRVKKYHSEWWEALLKWSFIAAGGSLTIWVAGKMMQAIIDAHAPTVDIIKIIVILMFLVVGFKMTRKNSGEVAGAIMTAAKWGGGAAAIAGGAAWQLSGRNRFSQGAREAISNRTARISEGLGFAPQGHASQQKSARAATARKQVDAMRTGSAGDKARYEQLVQNGNGPMGAAAISAASENGDLSRILGNNMDHINQHVAYAQSFGYERGDFEKKDYRLAGFNDSKTNQALTAMGHRATIDASLTAAGINPTTATATQRVAHAPAGSLTAARESARITQLRSNLPQMSGNELRNIDDSHLANYDIVKEDISAEKIKQFQTADPAKILALKAHVGHLGAPGTLMDDYAIALASDDKAESNRLQKKILAIQGLP